MPNLCPLRDPEAFRGNLSTAGRRLPKELLEGTMEAYRDQRVEVPWHQPAADRHRPATSGPPSSTRRMPSPAGLGRSTRRDPATDISW